MNSIMDQELADLKADFADLQKEKARLERELQEAYDDSPVTPIVPLVVEQEVTSLKSEISQLSKERQQAQTDLAEEQKKVQNLKNDYIKALSLLEVVRLNKEQSWQYFTTTDGRQRLEWIKRSYEREMNGFLSNLGGK